MIDKSEITAYTTLRDNEMLRRVSIVSSSDINRSTTDYYNVDVYVGSKGGGLDLLGSFYGNKNTLQAGTSFKIDRRLSPGSYTDRRMRNGESIVVRLTRQGKPVPSANSYTVQILMAVTAGASDKEQPILDMTMGPESLRPGRDGAVAHAIQSSGMREWSISVPLQDPTDTTDYVEIDTDGYARADQLGSGTASSSTVLRGDNTWGAAPSPWTYVVLGSDFTTAAPTNTFQDVTGMAFTPASNKKYMIDMFFLVTTVASATGARPGIKWPTAGVTNNAGWVGVANSATSFVYHTWGGTTTNGPNTLSLANNTQSWPAYGSAVLIMGAGATGNFQIVLASEVLGSAVTMKANSYFRYREYP